MNQPQSNENFWWRNKLVRIYISGVILLALGIVMWKFVFRYSPWYEILSDPVLASILTVLSIVVLPMILGVVFVYGFNPLLGRWQKWSDLMRMQDRLLGELSIDSAPQIVLINWPSDDVRTAGVLTATFPATDSQPEMASVYCPSAPRANFGRIFFVKVADLQFTQWTLNQYQVFNWTVGSICPDQL